MAAGNQKAETAGAEALALERALTALERDGAVKLSSVGSKTLRAAVVSALVKHGFELTKAAVRKPLVDQLTAALAEGAFIPLKSAAHHLAGTTAAEAKQLALALVVDGKARLVLRGAEEVVVPVATPVLSPDQLAQLVELAKVVAKAAKSKTGASLLRTDLDDALARVLPAPGDRRVLRLQASSGDGRAADARPMLLERLLVVVDATRDVRTGLSFIPTILEQLRPELSPEAASAVLIDAANAGLLELRPEGGINRLSEAELQLTSLLDLRFAVGGLHLHHGLISMWTKCNASTPILAVRLEPS